MRRMGMQDGMRRILETQQNSATILIVLDAAHRNQPKKP
jgi:hypothetical protein